VPQNRLSASLIYNPNAGRRRHAQTIEGIKAALEAAYEISTRPTSGPRNAVDLAREAARRGDAAVFAWGGDGTLCEVAEGLLGSPTMLGVLPGGTFNVVALALGLPRTRPIEAARALVHASPEGRDVGLIGSRAFLMQATAGVDGYLMNRMKAELKAKFGMAGVFAKGARSFFRYRFRPFDVAVDGARHTVTGAAFVNMTEYAGHYRFIPGARWDDRQAHALLYTGRTHLSGLMFAVGLLLGRHHRQRTVSIQEATDLTFLGGSQVFVQADGDPWRGDLPVTCRLAAEQIQVLIPRTRM
jgi:diacylglycerol kinase (ATP)